MNFFFFFFFVFKRLCDSSPDKLRTPFLQGRNTPQDAGLWSDEHVAPLKRIVDFIHSQSQKVGIQLQHAGRKCGVCPPWLGLRLVPDQFGGYARDVRGPTAEPWNENYATPLEMSETEIYQTIDAYGQAARRAVQAGADVIAVHGAHGYLLHEFASPAVRSPFCHYLTLFQMRDANFFFFFFFFFFFCSFEDKQKNRQMGRLL